MTYFSNFPLNTSNSAAHCRSALLGALVLAAAVGLSACGSKEKKAGQALARVNGEEITSLQVNDELSRANVKPEQQETATKQVLESLIDRQLVLAEAMRLKLDRSPEVMKAIERAKAQIIVQAYLNGATAKTEKPTQVEIDEYFQSHPEYFSKRKQFNMKQLILSTTDLDNKLKPTIDAAKSLDEIAAWMDMHNISYRHGEVSRTTADLPPEMAAKLSAMPNAQLFVVREGESSSINALAGVVDSSVTAKDAAPQITQYLINKKAKEIADAEIKVLRSSAKIDYLNAAAAKDNTAAPASAPAAAPEAKGADAGSQSEPGTAGAK